VAQIRIPSLLGLVRFGHNRNLFGHQHSTEMTAHCPET